MCLCMDWDCLLYLVEFLNECSQYTYIYTTNVVTIICFDASKMTCAHRVAITYYHTVLDKSQNDYRVKPSRRLFRAPQALYILETVIIWKFSTFRFRMASDSEIVCDLTSGVFRNGIRLKSISGCSAWNIGFRCYMIKLLNWPTKRNILFIL